MANQEGWIWVIILFGIGIGLWSLVTRRKPGRNPGRKPGRKQQKFSSPLRTCSTDPPPICDPQEGGGWGNCNDAQGRCSLQRECGTMLKCGGPFTCTDALGACLWY